MFILTRPLLRAHVASTGALSEKTMSPFSHFFSFSQSLQVEYCWSFLCCLRLLVCLQKSTSVKEPRCRVTTMGAAVFLKEKSSAVAANTSRARNANKVRWLPTHTHACRHTHNLSRRHTHTQAHAFTYTRTQLSRFKPRLASNQPFPR